MQTWALIVDSFRESRDKKLFWVMLLVSTLAALSLACIGFDENGWSFFFGAIKKADPQFTKGSPAAVGIMGAIVSNFLIGTYIAWMGTVACLVATAGIFPNFMEKGTIDVVLSKPMSRITVFAGKYIGSLGFVFVQAAYFVLLSFLILRLQVGRWLWGYLWCIPLLVLLFSFLYCVCVLLAMWTRSTLASLALTLLFWMAIPGVAIMDDTLAGRMSFSGAPGAERAWGERGTAGKIARLVRLALPKTSDIPTLAGQQMGASSITETMSLFGEASKAMMTDAGRQQLRSEEERQASLSAFDVIGSSLIFEGVVLLIAGGMFCRRDF